MCEEMHNYTTVANFGRRKELEVLATVQCIHAYTGLCNACILSFVNLCHSNISLKHTTADQAALLHHLDVSSYPTGGAAHLHFCPARCCCRDSDNRVPKHPRSSPKEKKI